MGKYDYIEKPAGGGWLLEVRKGASRKGNIRKNPITGRFQFYRGSANAVRVMFEESDMDALKKRIEESNL